MLDQPSFFKLQLCSIVYIYLSLSCLFVVYVLLKTSSTRTNYLTSLPDTIWICDIITMVGHVDNRHLWAFVGLQLSRSVLADEGKGGGLGAFLPKVSSRLWPKEQKDQVGLILGLVSPLLLFLIEIFAVLPYYQKTESLSIHVVWLPMTFFLINYYGNLYKFIATDPNGGRQDLPIMQKQDFK